VDWSSLTYTYFYDQPVGKNVDIYVIDSGVYTEHTEFETRASWGYVSKGLSTKDDNGHGTHVAGIAAGKTFGVAKNANIIAVKVLDQSGFTTVDACISGINWVAGRPGLTRRPSIALMAFSVNRSFAINDATTILVRSGVTVTTAAGNIGRDASYMSPGSATDVITAGSSNILNVMTPGSNFGKLVNIFAPGEFIISAAIGAPNSTEVRSGTSMASAHVAGIAASILSMNPTMKPSDVAAKIQDLATTGVVAGVPAGTTSNLVYNGYNVV